MYEIKKIDLVKSTEDSYSWLDSIIIFFIYISIFINSIVLLRSPFEFYFGYLVFILLLPVFLTRYGINRYIGLVFGVLFVTGIFNIIIGNNTIELFLKVYVGLLMSYVFYDSVLKQFKFNLTKLFGWYMIGAYIVSLIGVIQFISFQFGFKLGYDYSWILNKWSLVHGGNFGIRVNSVFAEPTYLAGVISPAFFISLYNFTRQKSHFVSRWRGAIIILALLLSFSSLGPLAIVLSVLLLMLNFGLIRYFLVAIILGFFLLNFFYENVGEFRERFDSLVSLGNEGASAFKLGKTHGSSYILFNNYHVATENFKSNFAFGSGIGSHPVAFDKYSLAKNIRVTGFNNNSADANSMLLRLISETGLFGIVLFLIIVLKCYVFRNEAHDTNHWLISNSLLVMILLNLLRQGHYFLNGFPFFVLIYIYNYLSYQKLMATGNADLSETGQIEGSPENSLSS